MEMTLWLWLPLLASASVSSPPLYPFGQRDLTVTRLADVEPPCLVNGCALRRSRTARVLMRHWNVRRSGFVDDDELAGVGKEKTYGEVTILGARQLAHAWQLSTDSPHSAVFADLGSGVGKLSAQMYLDNSAVLRSVGIELSAMRHARGVSSLAALRDSPDGTMLNHADSITLLHGDALSVPVDAIRDVTHVYIAALCFSTPLLARFGAELANRSRYRALRHVASLRRMAQLAPSAGWREAPYPIELQVTWGSARAYLYSRSLGPNLEGSPSGEGDEL